MVISKKKIMLLNTTYKVLESDKDCSVAALAQCTVSVWYREDPDLIV